MNIFQAIPAGVNGIAKAMPRVAKDPCRRSGEEIAVLIHEQRAKRRNKKRRELDRPAAVFPGPGGHRQRHPIRPDFLLRLDQQSQTFARAEHALAHRLGLRIWRLGAEQPYRRIGSAAAHMAYSRRAAFRRNPENGGDFPVVFSRQSQAGTQLAQWRESVHFRMAKAAIGMAEAATQTGV